MRALLWLIGLFALAVGVAMLAKANDGYVLIVLFPWRVQLSLNMLVVFLATGFVGLYFLLRLIRYTLALPEQVVSWRQQRRREKADLALREALQTLFEGRFAQALKSASKAFSVSDRPSVAALVAARAAHAMHDDTRYRTWIAHAAERGDEVRFARLMTETELAIEGRRFEEAAQLLELLKEDGHKNIAVLRLSLRVAAEQGQWEEVLRLTRQLHKHKALSDEQFVPLVREAHCKRLKELAHDRAALERYWKEVPSAELNDRQLIEMAMPILAEAGCAVLARRTLERLLDEVWDSELARLYAYCAEGEGDAVSCLAQAEKWLRRQPKDSGLLFALGRLCIGAQLWGKAQSYLEASLNIKPAVETHLALAHLLEQLERAEEAQTHYRAAAERVAGKAG